MAITKVQSVQGQGTKTDKFSVRAKDMGLWPAGKSQQKQTPKNTTKRA